MPAHSILGWLRRRRSLARATWRFADPLAARTAAARHGASRPVLHAPLNWRERMLASVEPTPLAPWSYGADDDVAAPYVAPADVEPTMVMGDVSAPRPVRPPDGAAPPAAHPASPMRAPTIAAPSPVAPVPTRDHVAATERSRVTAPVVPPAGSPIASPATAADAPPVDVHAVSATPAVASDPEPQAAPMPSEIESIAPRVERAASIDDERTVQTETTAITPRREIDRAPAGPSEAAPAAEWEVIAAPAPITAASVAATGETSETSAAPIAESTTIADAARAPVAAPVAAPAPHDHRADEPSAPTHESSAAPLVAVPIAPATEPPVASAAPEIEPPPSQAIAAATASVDGAAIAPVLAPAPAPMHRTDAPATPVSAEARIDAPDPAIAFVQDVNVSPESREIAAPVTPIAPAASTPVDAAPTDASRPIEVRRARRPATRPAPPAEASGEPERVAAMKKAPSAPTPEPEPAEPEPPRAERSLEEWRRLLIEATTDRKTASAPAPAPAPATAPSPAPRAPAAPTPRAGAPVPTATPSDTVPLLESTRRFLRPLVGIDPATVPVIRGPEADRLVAAASADAAAVGEAIALPTTHDERSPRTLGLLAHELTHVAQRRAPRFVPPVLRAPPVASREPHAPVPHAEESLAQHVEHAVWQAAERGPERAAEREPEPAIAHASHDEWGGLPAPWEPLGNASSMPGMPNIGAAATASATATMAAPADATPVHFAPQGRATEGDEHTAGAHDAHAASAAATPPPDLDALARRVYDVLKRRLAAERRREG